MKTVKTILALLLFAQVTAFAQDCSQILKGGIYDVYQSSSATERASSFINWFKQKQFSSYEEAKKTSASLSIPIVDIIIKAGFSNDEKGFSQFSNEIDSYAASSESFKQTLSSQINVVNPQVVAAWNSCITQTGMHFWVERTDDPKTFYVCAKYVDNGARLQPYLKAFYISNTTTSSDGPYINKLGTRKHVIFSGRKISQLFTIKDIYSPVAININASVGDGLQQTLPVVRPSIKFSISESKIWIGSAITISWHATSADYVFIDDFGKQPAVGQKTITPNTSRTFHCFAYRKNEDEPVSQANVSVEVNTPVLTRVECFWDTIGDDKDWNTQPNITVVDKNGNPIASKACCSAARGDCKNDNWCKDMHTGGIFSAQEANGLNSPLSNFTNWSFNASRIPVKNDDWDYKATVVLTFSNGTVLTTDGSGRNSVGGRWPK